MNALLIFTAATIVFSSPDSTATAAPTVAQSSAPSTASGDRGVMLNAEVSNKPRDINIGLPVANAGTIVMEDGLVLNFPDYPMYQYHHWVGGSSYSSQSLMSLGEAAILTGDMGYVVNSWTRLGGEQVSGVFKSATSSDGRIKFDGNLNGPLSNGWHYSLGAYINMDPTGVHPLQQAFVNNMQVYKAALTKHWGGGRGESSLMYKLSINDDIHSKYAVAPFYYVGDGSISLYNGFRLGRDNYFPDDDSINFIDAIDGHERSDNMLGNMKRSYIHDFMFRTSYIFDNGWKMEASIHPCFTPSFNQVSHTASAIDIVANGKNQKGQSMTFADGSLCPDGLMQNRTMLYTEMSYFDLVRRVKFSRRIGGHNFYFGTYGLGLSHGLKASSASFGHTVEANPKRIYRDGQSSWNYNTSAKYFDGWSNFSALFGYDEWQIIPSLSLQYGILAGVQHLEVTSAINPEGETCNNRVSGFYVQNGICRPQFSERTGLKYTGTASLQWDINPRMHLIADGLYRNAPTIISVFFNAQEPSHKPTVTGYGSGTFKWEIIDRPLFGLDFSTSLSYIGMFNARASVDASKQINGVSESQNYLADYNTRTLGWSSTMNLRAEGFRFRLMTTWQEPKYSDYVCTLTFSDNSTQTFDYTGNYLTGISRVLVEMDPSYSYKNWRIWASVRYYSRQYANRTNNVYFNGHWETFAGVSHVFRNGIDLGLNVVNPLCSTGAKGTIPAADTITDSNLLNNYLIAGSYIIPLTFNLELGYKF